MGPGKRLALIGLGISPPQLFGWRKAFLNKQKEDVPPVASVPLVDIVVGDVIIRVGPDISEVALRRILRVVRSA